MHLRRERLARSPRPGPSAARTSASARSAGRRRSRRRTRPARCGTADRRASSSSAPRTAGSCRSRSTGTSKRRGSLSGTAPRTTSTGCGTARRRNSAEVRRRRCPRCSSPAPRAPPRWAAGPRPARSSTASMAAPCLERSGVDVDRAPDAVGTPVDDLADERAAAAVPDEDDVTVEAVDEVGDRADVVVAGDARRGRLGFEAGQGQGVDVEVVGQRGDDGVPRPRAEPETGDRGSVRWSCTERPPGAVTPACHLCVTMLGP